jgi:anti-sigma factor RsiW
MTTLRHRRLRSLLDAFVDGELHPSTAAQVGAHLRRCWWCSGQVQSARLVKVALARRRAVGVFQSVERLRRLGPETDHT